MKTRVDACVGCQTTGDGSELAKLLESWSLAKQQTPTWKPPLTKMKMVTANLVLETVCEDKVRRLYTSSIMGQLRGMCDGFGLCSPGWWPPERRKNSNDVSSLGFLEELGGELESLLCRQLASWFADGQVVSCPFNAELIEEGRDFQSLGLRKRDVAHA